MARKKRSDADDEICEFCGVPYGFDEGVFCPDCDRRLCAACLMGQEERGCPDCCEEGFPRNISPMLSQLSPVPRDLENWCCEYKWEGTRTLCYWDGASLSLKTRNQRDITALCPELRDLPRELGSVPMILDGQTVCLGRDGRPSYRLLERRVHASPWDAPNLSRKMPLRFFAFDVLLKGDRWLAGEPYWRRREILEELETGRGTLRVSPAYRGGAKGLLKVARQQGLPGIICKRLDSVYEPGTYSSNWRKVNIHREQDFVIGGWTAGRRSRETAASLLLGYHVAGGELVYAGQASWDSDEANGDILQAALRRCSRNESPFRATPRKSGVAYLSPRLVVRVRFEGWEEGKIRGGAYIVLKADKDAADVFREEEV